MRSDVSGTNYTEYPKLWQLAAEPEPEFLRDFLRWIIEDDERLASATDAMRWLPVGFFALPLAHKTNPQTGVAEETLQINFYHEDYPGNEHPHSHARDAHSVWYAQPRTRQHITRLMLLPADRIDSEPGQEERQLVANSIIDDDGGGRAAYAVLKVGQRAVRQLSQSHVVALGSQDFSSLEIHYIGMDGPGVAMSTHFKDKEEPRGLSTFGGLVDYKRLTPEEAGIVTAQRTQIEKDLQRSGDAKRLGPTTLILPPLDFDISELRGESAPSPPTEVAHSLLLGGLITAEMLAKQA